MPTNRVLIVRVIRDHVAQIGHSLHRGDQILPGPERVHLQMKVLQGLSWGSMVYLEVNHGLGVPQREIIVWE